MHIIEQSTSITVRIGPFVDEDDGKTAETGLTISQSDIRLSKNGGDFAQTNDSGGATHDENGWYYLTLDATDTNTLGRLIVAIHESGALPVWREFMVVTANVWDSLIGGTDYLQTDAQEIEGTTATDQINSEVDTAIEDYHLDHLLAADYDPSSKPGVATALLNELVENDEGVSRFTENALEQAVVAAVANKIADHVIRRSFENACDSSDGDAKSYRSLLGAIAKLVNKIAVSGSTLTVYEDDDTTSLGTQTVTSESADPITALDTD